MGKVVGSILLIAAAAAIAFVPGVGLGLGMTLVNSIGISATLASSIVTGIAIAGASAAIGLVGSLFASKPKPETTEQSIKSPRPPRVSAYGRSRLYGAQVLFASGTNGFALDVYAVHDGKIDGIEQRYLADDAVWLTGDFVAGGADGRYGSNKLTWHNTDGSVPGAPFTTVASLAPSTWSSDHRGDGVVALCLISATVQSSEFSTIYPQSIPPTPSIAARWQKCPDPSAVDPLDESAWTWTECPVRHLLHYMLVREGPRPALPKSNAGYAAELAALREVWWARKIAPTLDFWIAAASDCNSARPLKAGGTEARYRSCVNHKHTDTHEAVKSAILATFDGWMAPRADGAYVIYSGRYYAPTVTIGPDEIISYSWQGGGVDNDQAVNMLVCEYVSSLHKYATVPCDPWSDDDDISRRGQELSDTLSPGVPSHAQVRALAKRLMARRNAKNRGSVTTNISGRAARGQRYVYLRLAEGNVVFFDGVAEITKLSRTIGGGVSFEWVEADPNIDLWNPATEEGNPAAIGTTEALVPLVTPTIVSAGAVYDGTAVRLQVQVEGADRDDMTWYAHWRMVGASVWGADEAYTDADDGLAITLNTSVVPPEASIEIQVAYSVSDGRNSPWSAASTVSTATSALAPSNATSLSATGGSGSATVAWRNPTSANLGYVRVYRSATSSFGGASQIGGDIVGGLGELMSYVYSGSVGTHYFWVRPFSTAGVAGTLSGPVSAVIS